MELDEAGRESPLVFVGLRSWSWRHFFLMLVLCKPILELLTEHYAPCSGRSEQDCLTGFQDVDFATLQGL